MTNYFSVKLNFDYDHLHPFDLSIIYNTFHLEFRFIILIGRDWINFDFITYFILDVIIDKFNFLDFNHLGCVPYIDSNFQGFIEYYLKMLNVLIYLYFQVIIEDYYRMLNVLICLYFQDTIEDYFRMLNVLIFLCYQKFII